MVLLWNIGSVRGKRSQGATSRRIVLVFAGDQGLPRLFLGACVLILGLVGTLAAESDNAQKADTIAEAPPSPINWLRSVSSRGFASSWWPRSRCVTTPPRSRLMRTAGCLSLKCGTTRTVVTRPPTWAASACFRSRGGGSFPLEHRLRRGSSVAVRAGLLRGWRLRSGNAGYRLPQGF